MLGWLGNVDPVGLFLRYAWGTNCLGYNKIEMSQLFRLSLLEPEVSTGSFFKERILEAWKLNHQITELEREGARHEGGAERDTGKVIFLAPKEERQKIGHTQSFSFLDRSLVNSIML